MSKSIILVEIHIDEESVYLDQFAKKINYFSQKRLLPIAPYHNLFTKVQERLQFFVNVCILET
jgi:hypothetical protein